jgi:hypothetical protein
MVARYWIAQHVEDLFRNEPRNVGVFVRVGSSVAARFFGEVEGGGIDGRKLKSLPYPDVYRQWVEYWRDQVASGREKFEQVSGSHYWVVEGGAVSDIDRDSADEVAAYLYSLLVSRHSDFDWFRQLRRGRDSGQDRHAPSFRAPARS